jgi:hypothetical protein
MNAENRLPLALLLLRLSVFVVMFVWTVDKFVEPQHGIQDHGGVLFDRRPRNRANLSPRGDRTCYYPGVFFGIRQTVELRSCIAAARYFHTVILSKILKPAPTS